MRRASPKPPDQQMLPYRRTRQNIPHPVVGAVRAAGENPRCNPIPARRYLQIRRQSYMSTVDVILRESRFRRTSLLQSRFLALSGKIRQISSNIYSTYLLSVPAYVSKGGFAAGKIRKIFIDFRRVGDRLITFESFVH